MRNFGNGMIVAAIGVLALVPEARAQATQLRLNEVLALNENVIGNGETFPDYVEIYNPSGSSVNLGGMSLSDDAATPKKYVFPSLILDPNSYLIVWCDADFSASGLHTGFGLNASGEMLRLYTSGGAIVDQVSFGIQIADHSIGRIPDSTGAWQLNQPTPAGANVQQPLGANSGLKINEWLASNSDGEDWVEVYNPAEAPVALSGLVLTDQAVGAPQNRAVPALSFIAAGGFVQFMADDLASSDADHLDFKLSASGETLLLYAANRSTVIDQIQFGAQTTDVSQGRLPDGDSRIVSFPISRSTPGASNFLPLTNVVINEVLAHTDPPLEDAIELRNPTLNAVDISHWWLSNARRTPKKFQIPAGTILPAGGFIVFYEYQFNPTGDGVSPSFTLNSSRGDEVHLFTADASGELTGFRATQEFDATANGASMGRVATSAGFDFAPLVARTFGAGDPATLEQFRQGQGAANAGPLIGSVVITELMYHPPEIMEGTNVVENTDDEFVELQNITTGPVRLYDPQHPGNTWRLNGGVDFNFPLNITLPPGGAILVVNFDPAAEPSTLSAFRTKYSVPEGTVIVGPYSGNLSNGGENVDLQRPDSPQGPGPDEGFVPYILVDRVDYDDVSPWPEAPDGTGESLQKADLDAYGNDPAHWMSAAPTAGVSEGGPIVIEISEIRQAGGTVVIDAHAPANGSYTLQGGDSLSGGAWSDVETKTTTAGGTAQFTRPIEAAEASRFFRISFEGN